MFAAYAAPTQCDDHQSTSTPEASCSASTAVGQSWLSNVSYKKKDADVVSIASTSSANENDVLVVHEKLKKAKKKHKKRGKSDIVVEIKPTPQPTQIIVKWTFEPDACAVEDRRGDAQNYGYASTYARLIARHRQSVSAIPRHLRKIIPQKPIRYYTRAQLHKFLTHETKPRLVRRDVHEWHDEVPLQEALVIDDETGNELVYEPTTQMYRAKVEDELTAVAPMSASERLSKQLHGTVDATPADWRAWIQLVKLQPQLYAQKRNVNENETTESTQRAVADRQLSMLDRALRVGGDEVELRLLRVQIAGVHLWDELRTMEEWRKMRFAYPNSTRMWLAWLDYAQSVFRSFTMPAMMGHFDDCITRVSLVLAGRLLSHPPLPHCERDLLTIALRRIELLKHAAHTERAFASLQALVEFVFFAPSNVTQAALSTHFEAWWHRDDVARFGEDGACGWCNASISKIDRVKSNPQTLIDAERRALDSLTADASKRTAAETTGRAWVALERARTDYQWLPVTQQEDTDDPDAIVLFDDVKIMLIQVNDEANRFRLLQFVLQFFDARVPNVVSSNATKGDCAADAFPLLFPTTTVNAWSALCTADGVDDFLHRCVRIIRTDIYASRQPFDAYFACAHLQAVLQRRVHALDTATTRDKERALKTVARAFMAKPMNQQLPLLYAVYANALMTIDAHKTAIDTLRAAVAARGPALCALLDGPHALNSVSLFDALTSLTLLDDFLRIKVECAPDSAYLLATVTEIASVVFNDYHDTTIVGVRLVRAVNAACTAYKQRLGTSVVCTFDDRVLHGWLGTCHSRLSSICALLTYCASTHQFAQCVAILDEAMQAIDEGAKLVTANENQQCAFECTHERLTSVRVLLHRRQLVLEPRTTAPRTLTLAVRAAIARYPNNAEFTRAYVDQLSTSLNRLTLRIHFQRAYRTDAFAHAQLYGAVYTECHRYMHALNNQRSLSVNNVRQSLRDVLERAPASVPLWLLWMRIEHERAPFASKSGDGGRVSSLDGVFYRSVGACPYAHVLYTTYAEYRPTQWSTVVDLLTEKQLRLRVPREELQLLMNAHALPFDQPVDDNCDSDSGEDVL